MQLDYLRIVFHHFKAIVIVPPSNLAGNIYLAISQSPCKAAPIITLKDSQIARKGNSKAQTKTPPNNDSIQLAVIAADVIPVAPEQI